MNTKLIRTGFVVAALLGTCAAAYAASDNTTTAPRNAVNKAERAVSDSWITTKVKSEILANSVSKGFKVSVTTKKGAVTLKGKLPNSDAVELVKMIAEKVKGVKSVDTSGLAVGS
ncbi:BON domain-containing protein [Rhodoferax sp.]|uniref:BON domain-containing protein n=1 Tax=Rhodoferax sp. TaxID=50421 RepID=UPI00276DED85|nr:BON domain-containing protein [Rhodoferax sp.]